MILTQFNFKEISVLLVILLVIPNLVFAIPSFPGAVGRGAITQGGRAVIIQGRPVGHVYHVTKLTDDGSPGTLRHGLEKAKEHTTIVFDVGGVIYLQSRLKVRKSYLTIAGQTAPGEGITLAGYPLDIGKDCKGFKEREEGEVFYSGDCGKNFGFTDIIIRYVRFRLGDYNGYNPEDKNKPISQRRGNGNKDLGGAGGDAIKITNSKRIILDHVSASWSMDETIDIAYCSDVTVQNSIISEGLLYSFHGGPHSRAFLSVGFDKISDLNQGKGGYTLYGNLIAHQNLRSPLFGGFTKFKKVGDDKNVVPLTSAEKNPTNPNALFQRMDFINNVVYDWGARSGHTGRQNTLLNYVNNYLISGPSTKEFQGPSGVDNSNIAVREEDEEVDEGTFHIYQDGNYMDIDKDANHDGNLVGEGAFAGFETEEIKSEPLSFLMPEPFVSAEEAYTEVLNNAGASLHRDAVDARVVNEVRTRTGKIIDSQDDVGGIDSITEVHRPADFDTDGDGMPDTWEIAQGLNPNNTEDGNDTNISNEGYTNFEVYLNGLIEFDNFINDTDDDGISDANDNCTQIANPNQRDTDKDGYGNLCDGDLNNDGTVSFADLDLLRASFGTANPDADFDGNGSVSFADLDIFRSLFGKAPGPAELN